MLSKRGIDKLEKIMLANAKRYDQDVFADVAECGTMMCAAGFCRLMAVGNEQFTKEVVCHTKRFSKRFTSRCIADGRRILGLKTRNMLPVLFDYPSRWPNDLHDRFTALKTPTARVRFYIKMLRTRVNDDGSIRE
jgi:hypothetical protein